MTIEYRVEPTTATVAKPGTVDDFDQVPAWSVTRVSASMGWHIGRYSEKLAAETVARVLQGLAEYEVG